MYAISVRHARKMCQKNVRATRSVCTVYLGCPQRECKTEPRNVVDESNRESLQERLKSDLFLRKVVQTLLRGPVIWKDMRRKALNGTAKSSSCVRSPHHILTTISSKKRSWKRWRNCQKFVRGVSWSEVATVPKRKSHRGLDLDLSLNSEENIWKGWKESGGTK